MNRVRPFAAITVTIAASVLASAPRAHDLATSTAGAALETLPEADFDLAAARHLLMRAGFGAQASEVEALHGLGLAGLVDYLVDYEAQPEPPSSFAWKRAAQLPRPLDIARLDEKQRRELRQRVVRDERTQLVELRSTWMRRMIETKRPLEERMTLFWHGHFTTSFRDVRDTKLLWLQHELLRENATGNFGELLHEVSRDPAMLAYLNNNQNRKGKPNENYAREVMELFSLGIGNYEEKDIKEVARAFTGWTFDRRTARFVDSRRNHDTGIKTIFGQEGRYDGADVCDLLLAHEACAPYIAGKIFAYLAYENPEPELVAELGALLRSHRYELKPLLRRIFTSRAFYSARARGTQVKSPVVLLVSTTRMLGMGTSTAAGLVQAAAALGQELFAPPNVRGWEGGLSWITTSSLLERDNVCGALVGATNARDLMGRPGAEARAQERPILDRLKRVARARRGAAATQTRGFEACAFARRLGAKTVEDLVDGLAATILVVPLAAPTRAEILGFALGEDGSLPLRVDHLEGADMERKLREVLHLLMSTPEFQVC